MSEARSIPEDRRYLSSLNREDLWLTIEAYRNQIQMSTTMIEKQQQMLDRQGQILDRVGKLVEVQADALKEIRAITPELKRDVSERVSTCASDHAGVVEAITGFRRNMVEKQNDIKNAVHLGWVGMGSIILAIIGLALRK